MVLAGALLAAPLFAEGLSSVTGGTGTAWAGKYSIDNLENDFANNGKTQTGDAKSSNRTGTVGPEHAGDEIYGGLATTPSSQPHNTIASENTLTIEAQGEAVFSDRIAAGYAGSWGAGHSTANGNTLTINGNEKTSFSVFARAGYADNWGPGNSEASGNKLFFNNGSFSLLKLPALPAVLPSSTRAPKVLMSSLTTMKFTSLVRRQKFMQPSMAVMQ